MLFDKHHHTNHSLAPITNNFQVNYNSLNYPFSHNYNNNYNNHNNHNNNYNNSYFNIWEMSTGRTTICKRRHQARI